MLNEVVPRLKMLKRLFARGKGYPFDRLVRDTDVHTKLRKAMKTLSVASDRIMTKRGCGLNLSKPSRLRHNLLFSASSLDGIQP